MREDTIKAVKEAVEKLKEDGIPFLIMFGDQGVNGFGTYIKGNSDDLGSLLLSAAEKESGFAVLLKLVVNQLTIGVKEISEAFRPLKNE